MHSLQDLDRQTPPTSLILLQVRFSESVMLYLALSLSAEGGDESGR